MNVDKINKQKNKILKTFLIFLSLIIFSVNVNAEAHSFVINEGSCTDFISCNNLTFFTGNNKLMFNLSVDYALYYPFDQPEDNTTLVSYDNVLSMTEQGSGTLTFNKTRRKIGTSASCNSANNDHFRKADTDYYNASTGFMCTWFWVNFTGSEGNQFVIYDARAWPSNIDFYIRSDLGNTFIRNYVSDDIDYTGVSVLKKEWDFGCVVFNETDFCSYSNSGGWECNVRADGIENVASDAASEHAMFEEYFAVGDSEYSCIDDFVFAKSWDNKKSTVENLVNGYYLRQAEAKTNLTYSSINNRANVTIECGEFGSCCYKLTDQVTDEWYCGNTTNIKLDSTTNRNITILFNNTYANETPMFESFSVETGYEVVCNGFVNDTDNDFLLITADGSLTGNESDFAEKLLNNDIFNFSSCAVAADEYTNLTTAYDVDLIITSEGISGATISTKLETTTIGVMDIDNGAAENNELCSAMGTSIKSAVDIIDNSHFITSFSGTGDQTWTSDASNADYSRCTGSSWTDEATVLGVNPDDATIAHYLCYDSGDNLTDNKPSPARRCLNGIHLSNYYKWAEWTINMSIYVAQWTASLDTSASCTTLTGELNITSNTTLCAGTYYINDSIGDGAIEMDGSYLLLDCDGATLIGNGTGSAIRSDGRTENIIKDCNIISYNDAIRMSGNDNQVIDNNISMFTSSGVYILDGLNNIVKNNRIENASGIGFFQFRNANNTLVKNNFINKVDRGVLIQTDSTNVQIIGNTFYYINGSTSVGILLNRAGDTSDIINNTFNYTDIGIYSLVTNDVLIKSNIFDNITQYGDAFALPFRIEHSDNLSIINNSILDITTTGVWIFNSTNINVSDNYFEFLDNRDSSIKDYGDVRTAVSVSHQYKGLTGDAYGEGTNSSNIYILENSFASNVQTFIRDRGVDNLITDIVNYWFRSFDAPVNESLIDKFYFNNLTDEITNIFDGSGSSWLFNGWGSMVKDISYTINKTFMSFNVTEETSITIYNLSNIQPYNDVLNWTCYESFGIYSQCVLGTNVTEPTTYYLSDNEEIRISDYDLAPVISIVSPADNTINTTDTEVRFVYDLSDEDSSNCSLIVDEIYVRNESALVTGTYNFSYDFVDYGTYTWKISCIDNISNNGNSSEYTITFSAPATTTTTTSGDTGGGGGGASIVDSNINIVYGNDSLMNINYCSDDQTFTEKLFSNCKIEDNGLCDYGEDPLLTPKECNLNSVLDLSILNQMWLLRVFLLVAVFFLLKNNENFPFMVILLIGLFALNGAFGLQFQKDINIASEPTNNLDCSEFNFIKNIGSCIVPSKPIIGWIIVGTVGFFIIKRLYFNKGSKRRKR